MRLAGLSPKLWDRREQGGQMLFAPLEQGGRPRTPHEVLKQGVVAQGWDIWSAPGMSGVLGFPLAASMGKSWREVRNPLHGDRQQGERFRKHRGRRFIA